MEPRAKRTKAIQGKSNKKFLIIVAVLCTILMSVVAAIFVSMNKLVSKWDNRIYSNIYIKDTNIGGLTADEAKEKLNEDFQNKINNKELLVVINGNEHKFSYSDIGPIYDIDKTVEEAISLGKDSNIIGKYMAIKNADKNELELDFSFDEEKLNAVENSLASEVNEQSKNAKILISNGKISIEPEVNGHELNLEKLTAALKESINGDLDSQSKIEISTEVSEPKVKSSDLSKIDGVLGTFSTNYSSSAWGRATNIEIAVRKINGTLLMPGDTFSFNDVVGPRTAEAGFKEAGTYVGNKVEPGIGGGICQVSTTLYRAVMRANIRSVERMNHSMVVGYASPSLDATVAYGYIDYKFTNTYDFPVYIEGIIHGKNATFNVYGNVAGLGGKTYDMRHEIVETINPSVSVVNDNTLDAGTEVVEGQGTIGYKSIGYQITYENGVQVNSELISRDTYVKVDKIIKRGTKAVATAPVEPQVQPQAETEPALIEPGANTPAQ